jgi:mRNA-degrading endonuclease toxin of MazEF toxin-antitoxin module
MVKKFIGWIYNKIYIHSRTRVALVKEGEVYWCTLGENIGDEENGKGEDFRRPVLIFKKFNNNIFWGIPMSTKIKNNKYYVKVLLKNVEQSVMISQLRILDTKRLDEKMGYISYVEFLRVEESIINIIKNEI